MPRADVHVLADGTWLRFRPLRAEDREGLAKLFARLSPRSRQHRFLSPKRELTHQELAFMTSVDHVRHEAIAAIDQHDGSIVGVGRYVQYGERPKVAEVAVEVADELQGVGIGAALGMRTVQRARSNGVELLTATTLWENHAARALLRRLGFRARTSPGIEIDFALALEPRPADGRASAARAIRDARPEGTRAG